MLLIAVSAMAIPAHREHSTITQPDGTKLTIRLIGDEFYNFNTTVDGYTVVKNAAGVYEYAVREDNQLKASGVKARQVAERTVAEKAFLQSVTTYMTDRVEHAQGEAKRVKRDAPAAKAPINFSKFRGLIILINFSDVKFSMTNPNAFYNDMVNTKGFTGYTDGSGRRVPCTGSMRDYFSENSNGMFDPEFDVIGPVNINYSSTYVNQTTYATTIFKAALAAAEAQGVDFSKYDMDNNGVVDMVFFQAAGMSSSFAGNNSRLLWPHQSSLGWSSPTYDGKRFGTYACSTEIYGWSDTPSSLTVEGIGTMVHEFSHVMGFPDLYDANYETGGQSHDPNEWDIMAGGGSFNSGRTPCGYTIFERYSMGFAKPTVITKPGHYTLNPVMSNEGYILKSPVNREYFIMDNRQKTRWDLYLPGHGMIIARVDSTSTTPWTNNTVNSNSNHNYYELLRAGNTTSGDLASDPFPGTKNIVTVSNTTKPSLKTWAGKDNDFMINKIVERNGIIEFDIAQAGVLQCLVEDFEKMPLSTSTTSYDVPGNFATWTLSRDKIVAPGAGNCNGTQALSTLSSGVATMTSDVYCDDIYRVEATVVNPTTADSKFRLSASVDGGNTWTAITGDQTATLGSTTTLIWSISYSCPVRFRINTTSGSKTNGCFLDDLKLFYDGEQHEIKPAIKGDVNGDGIVDVDDMNTVINIVLGLVDAARFDGRADVNGDGKVDVEDMSGIINIMLQN